MVYSPALVPWRHVVCGDPDSVVYSVADDTVAGECDMCRSAETKTFFPGTGIKGYLREIFQEQKLCMAERDRTLTIFSEWKGTECCVYIGIERTYLLVTGE